MLMPILVLIPYEIRLLDVGTVARSLRVIQVTAHLSSSNYEFPVS